MSDANNSLVSKKMRLSSSAYRRHRFPPLAQAKTIDQRLSLGDGEQDTLVDIQQRLEAGFQQGIEQGHEEGFRQGLNQGVQQGLLEGQKEGFQKGFVSGERAGKKVFDEAVQPVHDLYKALSRWQLEKEQQQRQVICELVQKVAQQVIRAELTLMPQQILALVDETLGAMPGKHETVTVYLNPQDLERITQINTELAENWKLVAKPELPVGGCHLVTEEAEADASCHSRLEDCMDNIKQHLLEEVTLPQADVVNE